jgi:predicted amino acid-binding ACT domain protein
VERIAVPGIRPYHHAAGGDAVTVWFTVQLDDRPGALARLATALAERSVNIAGIVGIAEDTNGELMLETSDAAATRGVFDALRLRYQEHDATGGINPDGLSVSDVRDRSPRRAG